MAERSPLLRFFLPLGVFAVASYALFLKLEQDVFLKGTDAYYYALQVDWWAFTGHVRIADSSWLFPLLGLLQRAGLTTEAVLRGFLCTGLFLAATFLFFSSRAPLLRRTTASLWIVLSPTLLFTAIEFPKMFVVAALLPLWDLSRDRQRMIVSIATMILAMWAHRSGLVLIGFFVLGHWLDNKLENQKYVGAALILLTAVTFIFGDRSLLIDAQRFWPALHLARPGLFSLLERDSLPITLKIEMTGFAAFFAFLFFQKAFRPDSRVRFRYLVPGLLAFLPFGSEDVFSVGERFALFLPLLTVLTACEDGAPQEVAGDIPPAFYAVLCAAFLAAVVPGIRLDLAHPASFDPDYPQIRQVTKTLSQVEIPLLIANKNMAYYYKYALHREAFPYEPEDHWDKRRLWRLAYRIGPEELWPYLSNDCRNELLHDWPDYVLVREDCWNAARARLDPEQDSDIYARAWNHVWNPSQKRPTFLYPKHKDDEADEFPALPK